MAATQPSGLDALSLALTQSQMGSGSQQGNEPWQFPHTVAYEAILDGTEYELDPYKIGVSVQHVDSETFGIRAMRYDEDFVNHIKKLAYRLRSWDPELQLWRCPRLWYTQVLGHVMAAGFPVDVASRHRVEAQLGLQLAAPAPALLQQPLVQRILFHEEDAEEEVDIQPEERDVVPIAGVQAAAAEAGQQAAGAAAAGAATVAGPAAVAAGAAGPAAAATAAAGRSSPSRRRKRKEQEPGDGAMCVICLTEPREYALVPCGHFAYCASCAAGQARCALCRKGVTMSIKVFTA